MFPKSKLVLFMLPQSKPVTKEKFGFNPTAPAPTKHH